MVKSILNEQKIVSKNNRRLCVIRCVDPNEAKEIYKDRSERRSIVRL